MEGHRKARQICAVSSASERNLSAGSRRRRRAAGKADENSGVRWFMLDEAVEASTEEWMRTRVYEKLNRKVRALG